MNILVEEETGYITGIIDWAEASIQPFGMCLWGLENLIGGFDKNGWHYYDTRQDLERKFWEVLYSGIGEVSEDDMMRINLARKIGMLIR